MDFQEIIAGTVGKLNTFGTCVGRVKAGADELRALLHQRSCTGKIRGYVGEGQFTDDPLETFGGAGVVEIPRLQDLLRYICERGFEHHVAANFSTVAPRCTKRDHAAISAGTCYWHKGMSTVSSLALISARSAFASPSSISEKGRLGAGAAEYPLHRKKEDPDHATQSHADHMSALAEATRKALASSRRRRQRRRRPSRSTPPDRASFRSTTDLEPLDDYYLWCDHRAWREAAEITDEGARIRPGSDRLVRRHLFLRMGLREAAALAAPQSGEARPDWSPRWSIATWWRPSFAASPIAAKVPRSVCAMGHKWMWNESLGGLPPEEFLAAVDPLLAGVREQAGRPLSHLRSHCRHICPQSGRRSSACARAFRFRSARSTRIGTRSAPACASAMWST